jgi:23S rRNA (cytidine1920-2'-O)/16S rRNA (cytidine1409-2'-O)-methyltransferase
VLKEGGEFVSLIKPQFEAGRSALGKGGIVHSTAYRCLAVTRVLECAYENGFDCVGLMPSPIEGGDGNREYLALFEKNGALRKSSEAVNYKQLCRD